MKKSLLAIALMSAFSGAAFAQSSVTVYGIVDMGLVRDDNGVATVTKLDSGVDRGSRLGFKGTEDLGGGLKANFVLEMGILADAGASDQAGLAFGRQAYVGLSGDFGTVNLGRQKSLTYVATEIVDPFGLAYVATTNRFFKSTTRRDNAVTYVTTSMEGFSAAAQYGFGEVAGNTTASSTTAVSGTYAAGPAFATVVYENVKDVNGNKAADGQKLMLAGTYDFSVAKAHAIYEQMKGSKSLTDLATTEKNVYMIGVSAPVGAGKVLADFTALKNKTTGVTDSNSSQIAVGYTQDLSKRTIVYTGYSQTKNDAKVALGGAGAAGKTDKLFTAGVRHSF